ncbi:MULTISPECIES: undecaprenyl-phosphate glucose phosphotransferase [Microbulbifer]|uniref:undecaprenyl-phosphate glucose phosphotransferase n=1 Tax=Microbulbifer TaxID=48073 RepID=UPI001F37E436|nr:undecaprenyl-phosphate glucose phosphotransferase [Microbulbifer zhoushanensis]
MTNPQGDNVNQGWIRTHRRGITTLYRLFDLLLVQASLLLALQVLGIAPSKDWLIVALFAVVCFAFIAESVDLYRSWRSESYFKIVGTTAAAWLSVCVILLFAGYLSGYYADFPPRAVILWFGFGFTALTLWRYALRRVLFLLRAHDRNTRSAVIIGLSEAGLRLWREMDENPQLGIRCQGIYRVPGSTESGFGAEDFDGRAILGDVSDAIARARANRCDLVFIALPMHEEKRIADILAALADTTATVHMIPNFFVANMLHSRLHSIGDTSLLSIYDTPIQGINGWIKRLEDLLLASAILVLVSPVLLAVAIAVKLTSPGPVIFRQRRYGLDGRTIIVWKFRTMTVQDDGARVVQATQNDSRVTPVGRFLRRTSLDELPQFFNVLQGQMSIVGPRPHAVAHNEQYRGLVSGYMLRHKVKPGITGWAQVNGWRGETDTVDKMSKRIEHDLDYIRRWSLLLDLRIVLMTIFKGFGGKNAY